jgi:predicted metal-binding membrane protein
MYRRRGVFNLASLIKALRGSIAVSARPIQDEADEAKHDPSAYQRNVILALLLTLAAAAWAVLVWHHHGVSMDMRMASPPTLGLRAILFLTVWVVMMVAMMFPTTAPMILAFHKVQAAKRQPDDAFISAWVFVAAYLLIWALAGTATYAGELVAAAVRSTLGPASAAQFGGAILILAGLYQLTPLKEICLSECRTPIAMTTWYAEKADIFHMGLLHGLYCVGCYWLLFAALFPLGMSVGAMAAFTLIIFAEKALPWPTLVRYTTAVVLVLYGALMIASVQLTFLKDSSPAMPVDMQMTVPRVIAK